MDPQVLSAAGALLTAGLGFMAGRRIRSGRVSTTDADRLWAEAARLRADMGDQIAALRIQLVQKDERIEQLERTNRRQGERIDELERELASMKGNA